MGLARRKRFCRNCGCVVVADEGESCPECQKFSLTTNGEEWKRVRVRKETC